MDLLEVGRKAVIEVLEIAPLPVPVLHDGRKGRMAQIPAADTLCNPCLKALPPPKEGQRTPDEEAALARRCREEHVRTPKERCPMKGERQVESHSPQSGFPGAGPPDVGIESSGGFQIPMDHLAPKFVRIRMGLGTFVFR